MDMQQLPKKSKPNIETLEIQCLLKKIPNGISVCLEDLEDLQEILNGKNN